MEYRKQTLIIDKKKPAMNCLCKIAGFFYLLLILILREW